jgi:hypothetical protein|nr:MAG TPA: hypothetical protein [Caudoviricetes sp.]
MREYLFLYRIKNSDDRDCCAYINAAGPKFECNHYFGSITLRGSCYSGKEFPEYKEIETFLTKDEYEEILTFNIFIKSLGYGITKGDSKYKAGIKLIDSIKHIYDKLKSDEAFAFFEDIQNSEMEYLKEEYNLSDRDIKKILNEYTEDFRDRSIVSYVYDDSEEAGREEAWQLGYDSISSKHFGYKKFGENLVKNDYFMKLCDGRVVRLNY